ncbi:MAG: ABC transporter substrate-binding protein [Thermomicrobiales bacterium]|nr:ABC transporter substrate-binding protein [Thermomicrobiales bacterium]
MTRLDDLITDLTSQRIDRRRFMQSAAALGLSAPAMHLLNSSHILAAQENGTITWVSPRGRLEVFDDYPFWVAQSMGWVEGVNAVLEGGPAAGSERLVAEGQADMAYPSPGVFTLNLEADVPIASVFQMGAYDVFDFAFRTGEGITDMKEMEGKTIILGDASWQAIADPMLVAGGADHTTVEYVIAGVTAWGAALQQGQGDAALSWEGLRAQWDAEGLDFEYWLGIEHSKLPANSFVIRSADLADESKHEAYTNFLRAWAMGLEFGHHNPRAAAQITYNEPTISAGLQTSFPADDPEAIANAVASMWQLAVVYRGDFANRAGWGDHSMESWNLWFDTVRSIGLLTKEFATEDVVSNAFIAGANDFDYAMVQQAAADFELDELFSAVPEPEGAGA